MHKIMIDSWRRVLYNSDLQKHDRCKVAFGGANKVKITGIGYVRISSLVSIQYVLYVEGLKHNLLSISQLCDSGYMFSFSKDKWIVSLSDGQTIH